MSVRTMHHSEWLPIVADEMRKRRVALGLTQADCSLLLAAGESYWRGVEACHKSISVGRLIEIATVLGCTAGELLGPL